MNETLMIGLSFGFAVAILTIVLSPISGAHLNPAITIGSWFAGTMRARRAAGYIAAQLIGGSLAAVALWLIALGRTAPATLFALQSCEPAQNHAAGTLILVEFLASFIFVTVALGASSSGQTTIMAGLMTGLTLAALHTAFLPVAGNALNPARSIGHGLVSGCLSMLEVWRYILAPLAGGALAGLAVRAGLFISDDPVDKADP